MTRDQVKQPVAEREQGTPLSKTEAIRRAIAALGGNAQVPQILDYVRDHFGIGSGGSAVREGSGALRPPADSAPDRPDSARDRPEAPAEPASNPEPLSSHPAMSEQDEVEDPSAGKRSAARRGKPKDRPSAP